MRNRIVVFLRNRQTIDYKFVILYSFYSDGGFKVRNRGKRRTRRMVDIRKKVGRKGIESYLPEDFFTDGKYLSDLTANEVINKIKNTEGRTFSEFSYIRILMYDLNNKVTAYTYRNV